MAGGQDEVPLQNLEAIWRAGGRPDVSLVKIDVQGVEPEVIAGAGELLGACRPHLLVEAPMDPLRDVVTRALAALDLKPSQPPGVRALELPVRALTGRCLGATRRCPEWTMMIRVRGSEVTARGRHRGHVSPVPGDEATLRGLAH
jgi:hypothetical protein